MSPDTIVFVVDEKLTREKQKILSRVVNALRVRAKVEVLDGATTETKLMEVMQERKPVLTLVPWHKYLAWPKAEALPGAARTTGPAVAGYFADPLTAAELGETTTFPRAILLDYCRTGPLEAAKVTLALARDKSRSGALPLLAQGTRIHAEIWHPGQPQAGRGDVVMALPEVAEGPFATRGNAIRICLGALWSLVYDEGPGKGDHSRGGTGPGQIRAGLCVGADANTLVFRLCYPMAQWKPRDVLKAFWPDAHAPSKAAQLLLRYCDLVRVNSIAEAPEVEVTCAFFESAAAELAPNEMRALWIDSIGKQLVEEHPYPEPGPDFPYLVALPASPSAGPVRAAADSVEGAKDRLLLELKTRVNELRRNVSEKDETIRELKAGGIGTAPPLPPPDAESLLEAFQARYLEARYQLRMLEKRIHEIDQGGEGLSAQEYNRIKDEMNELRKRQTQWIRKLMEVVGHFREQVRKRQSEGA